MSRLKPIKSKKKELKSYKTYADSYLDSFDEIEDNVAETPRIPGINERHLDGEISVFTKK